MRERTPEEQSALDIGMKAISASFDEMRKTNKDIPDIEDCEPSPEQLKAAWNILVDSFQLELNANDLFYWGCADATEVGNSDYDLLMEAMVRFGAAGKVAFQWKLRGMKETVNCLDRRKWKDQYPAACEWIKDKMTYAERAVRQKEIEAEMQAK